MQCELKDPKDLPAQCEPKDPMELKALEWDPNKDLKVTVKAQCVPKNPMEREALEWEGTKAGLANLQAAAPAADIRNIRIIYKIKIFPKT